MTILVTFTDGSTFEGSTDERVLALVTRWMMSHSEKTVDDIVSITRQTPDA